VKANYSRFIWQACVSDRKGQSCTWMHTRMEIRNCTSLDNDEAKAELSFFWQGGVGSESVECR
jgi:hypothetical protein